MTRIVRIPLIVPLDRAAAAPDQQIGEAGVGPNVDAGLVGAVWDTETGNRLERGFGLRVVK
jgi:hypothetical protein